MKKIFIDAEEKFLGGVVVYGHSDNKLYTDSTHKVVVVNDEAANLFNKGLLLIDDGTAVYKPIAIKKSSNVYDITVLNGTGSTATFKVFKTSEPVK